jgi:hypothetical protein
VKARKQRPGKLPLDSPHWLPLNDAHRLHHETTGNRSLAAGDLTGALLSGHLRCMRRRVGRGVEPDREFVPSSFWAGYRLDSWSDALLIRARTHRGGVVPTLQGFAFYVWKPDLERIWPTAAPPSEGRADEAQTAPRRRKPGPKIKHNWRLHVAAETLRILEKQGRIPSARELAQFCENKFGYQPDESDIQKLIKILLSE